MRDFRRVQDLVLMIARWLLLAALVYAITQAPGEPLVPLPILVAFGLYTLFITIAFIVLVQLNYAAAPRLPVLSRI